MRGARQEADGRHDGAMARVLLFVPSATYRASAFLEAAARLNAEVIVASDRRQTLETVVPGHLLHLDFDDRESVVAAAVELAADRGLDAVVAIDDGGALAAAWAGEVLGLGQASPDAVAVARDKVLLRGRLAAHGLDQPEFAVLTEREGPALAEEAAKVGSQLGFPVVVKPARLAGSRGVIRADDPASASDAATRIRAILDGRGGDPDSAILLERYVEGEEVALEGLLHEGSLAVLALFDKPDPLVGPYFEETIYLTPSRHDPVVQDQVARAVSAACRAIGLERGPVHAEARLTPPGPDGSRRVVLLEVAARTIGGRCAKALRFAAGQSLEELVLAEALGAKPTDETEPGASGVMMLPIPRSGRLRAVLGREEALAVEHVTGLEITAPLGRPIRALPEGDRYLGFLFARGPNPVVVEAALRAAFSHLRIEIVADAKRAPIAALP